MSDAVRLFIGTATANGLMMSDHVHALMQMAARLHEVGIAHRYRTIDGPDLFIQRDMLAQDFLASDCTHLLLVDGHLAFAPNLVEQLLAGAKPLVAAIHPRRAVDLARLGQLAATNGFEAALALSYAWGVRLLGKTVTVENGFCRVAGFSSGFVLVARGCLTGLLAGGVPRYAGPQGRPMLDAFFRPVPPQDALRLDQEDLICRRWSEAGGEVWAHVAGELRHLAEFQFGVPFADYLNALAQRQKTR